MTREQLIRDHLGLARALAYKHRQRYDEDVCGDAFVGLVRAANRFEPGRAKFSTHAIPYIQGAILDQCRRTGRLTRRDANSSSLLYQARMRFEQREHRPPSQSELAIEMNISPLMLHELQARLLSADVGSLEGKLGDGDHHDSSSWLSDPAAERDLETVLNRVALRQAMSHLTRRDRLICLLVASGWTHKAIGQKLGITESRVCQLYQRALVALRYTFNAQV